jgi:hypothetical protein
MHPLPDVEPPPPAERGGGSERFVGAGDDRNGTSGVSQRCGCNLCLDGIRAKLTLAPWPDLAAIAESPGVVHDMPSSWWQMIVLGRDPHTGERAA